MILVRALLSIQLFIGLRKHLVIGPFSLFSFFLSFSLVTINRQTSCDSGILRHDNGIIRVFICRYQLANFACLRYPPPRLRNYTRFADEFSEVCRLGNRLGCSFTRTGRNGLALITTSDQIVRAVHSCNS